MSSAAKKSCPVCDKPADAGHAPFCSDRCRLLDLGRWLDESYVLPGDTGAPSGQEPDEGE